MENKEDRRARFYDVDRFRRIYLETMRKQGRVGRMVGRVTWSLDSMQGLWISLMILPIVFGTLGAVIIGATYGPFGFLLVFGSIIGGLAFFVDRRVGSSLQFGEYKFWRRTIAQTLAFGLGVGLILFILLLGRLNPF